MKISEVQIIPIKPKDGLIAFASVVLNECLYLGSIGIHSRIDGNGYRLTYPTKKVADKNLNLYHPINQELSRALEQAILQKAAEIL